MPSIRNKSIAQTTLFSSANSNVNNSPLHEQQQASALESNSHKLQTLIKRVTTVSAPHNISYHSRWKAIRSKESGEQTVQTFRYHVCLRTDEMKTIMAYDWISVDPLRAQIVWLCFMLGIPNWLVKVVGELIELPETFMIANDTFAVSSNTSLKVHRRFMIV